VSTWKASALAAKLPKQYGLDQKSDSHEKAVAEHEVPVASHGSPDIEAMRLHGFDYRDFFGAVFRRAEDSAYGMEDAVN
jgi:hypothetical protein